MCQAMSRQVFVLHLPRLTLRSNPGAFPSSVPSLLGENGLLNKQNLCSPFGQNNKVERMRKLGPTEGSVTEILKLSS